MLRAPWFGFGPSLSVTLRVPYSYFRENHPHAVLGTRHEAEAMAREVLAAAREVLGARHPRTLATMHNLAHTLWARGKHDEAAAMVREVRDLQA